MKCKRYTDISRWALQDIRGGNDDSRQFIPVRNQQKFIFIVCLNIFIDLSIYKGWCVSQRCPTGIQRAWYERERTESRRLDTCRNNSNSQPDVLNDFWHFWKWQIYTWPIVFEYDFKEFDCPTTKKFLVSAKFVCDKKNDNVTAR